MKLESPLTDIKGVGEALGKKYALLGIHSVADLIDYYPRRYDDYSQVLPIAHIKPHGALEGYDRRHNPYRRRNS